MIRQLTGIVLVLTLILTFGTVVNAATSRDASQKEFAERGVNVKWYGARPNDYKDDTEAFKKAINSGKRIFIPNGTYRITGVLNVPSDRTLMGESTLGTVILNNTNSYLFNLDNVNHITIKNITVKSENDNFTGGAIKSLKGYNLLFDGIRIEHKSGTLNKNISDGILLDGCFNAELYNSQILGGKKGVHILSSTNSSQIRIVNDLIQNQTEASIYIPYQQNTLDGMLIDSVGFSSHDVNADTIGVHVIGGGVFGLRIINSHFEFFRKYNLLSTGVLIDGSTKNVVIENNYGFDCYRMFKISDTNEITLKNNYLTNNYSTDEVNKASYLVEYGPNVNYVFQGLNRVLGAAGIKTGTVAKMDKDVNDLISKNEPIEINSNNPSIFMMETDNSINALMSAENGVFKVKKISDSKTYIATPFSVDLNTNNTQIGQGGYNTGHLTMGTYHLWIDSSGRLRVKNGAPTSDTDGSVVGMQN